MNNELVSIIITCYNQEKFILKVLESVKKQTFKNWECIIIDDGSTDRSAQIIKEVISGDDRYKYVFEDNQGVSKSRNLGFKLAQGTYIQFLDGDDTLMPNKLEIQLQKFAEYPNSSICICDHRYYFEKEGTYKNYEFERLKVKPLEQIVYKWHKGVAFPLHAPLYKRSIWSVDESPFPLNYKYRCEDWVFNVLVALKNYDYLMVDEILCNYHITSENFTSSELNVSTAVIQAAIYLNPLLPTKYQKDFLEVTIQNSLRKYLESEKINILKASGNWRVANAISKFVFKIIPIKK